MPKSNDVIKCSLKPVTTKLAENSKINSTNGMFQIIDLASKKKKKRKRPC